MAGTSHVLRLYFNYQAVLSPSAILRLHETHSFILLTSFSGLWDVPPLSPKLAVKTPPAAAELEALFQLHTEGAELLKEMNFAFILALTLM